MGAVLFQRFSSRWILKYRKFDDRPPGYSGTRAPTLERVRRKTAREAPPTLSPYFEAERRMGLNAA